MGGTDVGDPVAHRLVHGVLEGGAARLDGHDLGAEQLHAGHVEGLTVGVDPAHVDAALETHEGGDRRRRHAVLAGSGLGDDAPLPHAPGQQALSEHVVDLVAAGVVEVLALEQDAGPAAVALAEVAGLADRGGTARVVDLQIGELGGEPGVVLRGLEGLGQLLERGHERLRDEPAAERPVVAQGVGQRVRHDLTHWDSPSLDFRRRWWPPSWRARQRPGRRCARASPRRVPYPHRRRAPVRRRPPW